MRPVCQLTVVTLLGSFQKCRTGTTVQILLNQNLHLNKISRRLCNTLTFEKNSSRFFESACPVIITWNQTTSTSLCDRTPRCYYSPVEMQKLGSGNSHISQSSHTFKRARGSGSILVPSSAVIPSSDVLWGPTKSFQAHGSQHQGLPVHQPCISLYFKRPWVLKTSFPPVFVVMEKLLNLGNLFNEQLQILVPNYQQFNTKITGQFNCT